MRLDRDSATRLQSLHQATRANETVGAAQSETPAYIGGPIDRGAPCYGEDNEWVLGDLLGMSKAEIARLGDEDVI